MITIILIEPEHPGNVGAAARAMGNFGFESLAVVNPQCDIHDEEALKRATHARTILINAKKINIRQLKTSYDYLIGTTSKLGTDYNIPRSPVSPRELAELLEGKTNGKARIGILFGRESDGLHNDEIELCDYIVTIPTWKGMPALNLSHAVSIILYELFSKGISGTPQKRAKVSEHIISSSAREKEIIMGLLEKTLHSVDFLTEEKRETQRKVWKRMIGKSFMTRREAYALMGYLRKIHQGLESRAKSKKTKKTTANAAAKKKK